MKLVIMGVSGSGKTTIAQKLSTLLAIPYIDADDYHSKENVAKMRSGTPLTDEDRWGWLATLNEQLRCNSSLILACSALKEIYRDRLREGNPDIQFIYLKGSRELIWQRMTQRSNHYFTDQSLLINQFNVLQAPAPEEAIHVSIDGPMTEVVQDCLDQLTNQKDIKV